MKAPKKRAFKRFMVIVTDDTCHPHDRAIWFTVDAATREIAISTVEKHLADKNGVPAEECPFTINLCIEAKGLVRALNAVKPDLRAKETE